MVDLRPWRVPVAVILLVATAIRVGASLASIAGAAAGVSGLLTVLTGVGVGFEPGEIVSCVALAAICWWCTAEDVRGARGLAITAFALVAMQILLSIGATVAIFLLVVGGADVRIASLLIQLTWLVVPIVAAAVLLRCARVAPGSAQDAGSAPQQPALPAGEPDDVPVEDAEGTSPSYPEPAGAAPDQAAGAAWTSAGEAAKGGSAAGWGSGTGTSWEPTDWSSKAIPAAGAGDDAPPDASDAHRP